MLISLTMTSITTITNTNPKTVNQFTRSNITPITLYITLIFTLIVDYRFTIHRPPLTHTLDIPVLYTGVSYILFCVVVTVFKIAIVNRTQMVIRVVLTYNFEEAVPDVHRFITQHKIVLIGHRPPNMTISC